ncbi:hypothetical protein MGG_16229 [Pyricularia oryzae 70-15]|uniref:Uncharacterized protein n=3 Tax=Pyricularia oryzae TaxID=318829 RepID=G4MNV3_PYRO7|nr:uncharacterized protein MGG_16229 [Pyricularia oryzae 70-15]EHA57110.1 hypothetical protein MGG_16229 [Pyricularia oryzae 70-15]ELQ39881.1 hypothetical protein OOU_Y34scaffold00474g1 [Pyricularia oryzae Y34]
MASVSMALSGKGGPCKNDGDCIRCLNGKPLICDQPADGSPFVCKVAGGACQPP